MESQLNTCYHCNEGFQNEESYKQHYKSELHKYNLKRGLLDLPPISQQQYQSQFYSEKSQISASRQQLYCMPCGKSFDTKNTLNQHLRSKKHQQKIHQHNQKWNHQDKDTESDTTQSKELGNSQLGLDQCLFCEQRVLGVKQSFEHMVNSHGFFIPERQYLSDYKGLFSYLREQIIDQKQCLMCDKQFSKEQDVKKHMIDKYHCQIPQLNTQDPKYLQFYDFTQQLKQQLDKVDEDDEFDQENSKVQEQEINLDIKLKEFVEHMESLKQNIEDMDEGVQLENGKIIGHRQYKHIYKQYLRDYQEVQEKHQNQMIGDSEKQFQLRAISQEYSFSVQEKEAHSKQLDELNKIKRKQVPDNSMQRIKGRHGSDYQNSSWALINGGKRLGH